MSSVVIRCQCAGSMKSRIERERGGAERHRGRGEGVEEERRGKREVAHLELVLSCLSGWRGVEKVDCENLR